MFIGRIATERRNRIRPDDTAIVKVLLNRRRYHASHPDTIAAHGQDLVTPIFAPTAAFIASEYFVPSWKI